MALIGTIRKNGWILITLMTLALGGFILMEIIQNAQSYRSGDVNTLGKVGGAEIKRSDFDNYERYIYANSQNSPFAVRNSVWNYFVEKELVGSLSDQLGLNVGAEELSDLQFGNNISPIIAERFKDANGQPNKATLSSIKAAIEGGEFTDPNNRLYWSIQEKEVQKMRLQSKIIALVSKGIFTPAWQAEQAFRESNERASFLYTRIPFDKVTDDEAKVTDADYNAYLKENPKLYEQQEETRVVQYVSFDVYPTAEDSAAAFKNISDLAAGLRSAGSDTAFILSNDGMIDPGYTQVSGLPSVVSDSLSRLPIGTVVGPFMDNGAWNLAKILDRKSVPDSVKARHILIRAEAPGAEATIDSLKGLLEQGKAKFDELARTNSNDPGSAANGGDLGFFPQGVMVPEFNEVCFFKAEKGKYYKVSTQFGWHLIEVTDKKFTSSAPAVKAAYLRRAIEPSRATQAEVREKAMQIIESCNTLDEMNKKVEALGMAMQTSAPLRANDFQLGALGANEEAREMVRWAFDKKTRKGGISKEVFNFRDPSGGYFDSKYVIAGLQSIVPKGPATLETIKANPTASREVKNRKKAEVLTSKLKASTDLAAVAASFDVSVDTAENITLLQAALPNGGPEPKVVGTAFSAAAGSAKGPIVGNTGVYFVQPMAERVPAQLPGDLTLFRRQAASTNTSNVRIGLINSLRKTAGVEDFRSRFY